MGVSRNEHTIAGFFAHEDIRQGVQYDRKWTKEQIEGAEFEHLFFALDLEQGRVILQRKRIASDFVSINLSYLRRALFDLLGTVFLAAGFSSAEIRRIPFQEERKKSDLIGIFESYNITYVRITELRGKQVPDSLYLFNPDIDRDIILKQALRDDYENLDELEAKANESDVSANLRDAKTIRAAMAAGEPEEVRAVIDNHERAFRKTQRERFDMQLDTNVGELVQDNDIERLVRIIRTEYYIPESVAKRHLDFGPLFSLPSGEDDSNSE